MGVVSSGMVLVDDEFTVSSGVTVVDTQLGEEGYLFVSYGGVASNTAVGGYGYMEVKSGGVAINTTVYYDGYLEVNNALVNGLTVGYGAAVYISGTNKLTGRIMVDSRAGFTANETTTVDFDISSQTPESAAIVSYPGNIWGSATFTITLSASQAVGTYALATGAEGFVKTFTIGTTSTEYGTITVNGDALVNGDYTYTLTLTEGALDLTIAAGSIVPTSSGAIISDGVYTVSSGELWLETTINSGGNLYVSGGGVANSNTVNSEGNLYVSEGGVADVTTVNQGGYLWVDSSGLTDSTTVNSGGQLWVNGGTATNIVENGGYVYLDDYDPNTSATFATHTFSGLVLSDSVSATVHSGTTAVDVTVSDGTLEVRGGELSSATADSMGTIQVESGTVDSVTVNSGGLLKFMSGTVTNVMENGGAVIATESASVTFVSNTFSSLVLGSNVLATVHSGTTAVNTTVNEGELMVEGGVVNSVTVNVGGSLMINGGTAANIVENGGSVQSMGEAEITFVSNTFSNAVIDNYGAATVHSGTTAVDITVNDDANLDVFEGGVVNGLTADANAYIIFSSGKLTGPVTIAESAYLGVDAGTILNFDISAQTTESAALVNNLALINGAPTYTITVDAEQAEGTYALAGGAATFEGTLTLGTSDTEYGTITVNGDALVHEDYTFTLTVTEDALNLNVATGPAPISGMILIDSTYIVESGVTVLGTQVSSGGTLTVNDGGLADSTDVYTGGRMYVISGGVASSTTLHSSGGLYVSNGGFADSAVVTPEATMFIYSGGTATGIVEDGGYVTVATGASVTFASHTFSSLVLGSNVRATVHSGTTAVDITVNSRGYLYMSEGGVADSVTANVGGAIIINPGATVTNIVENGGNVTLGSSASATFASNTISGLVLESGTATLHSGTTAVDISVIGMAANVQAYDGGLISGLTVGSRGRANVFSGGKLTGSMMLVSGLMDMNVSSGGILDFDISAQTPESAALLNDYSLMRTRDGAVVTITVDAAQAEGVYALAANAANAALFAGTITLGTADMEYGAITVNGDPLVYGDYYYMLAVTEGALNLTVGIGEVISGMVVSGSSYEVNSGVIMLDTEVTFYGGLYVSTGGLVNRTTINSDGNLHVSAGGVANNNTINSSGNLWMYSGGMTDSTTVNPGGQLWVNGGTATNILENGGYVYLDDYDSTTSATFVSNTISGLVLDDFSQATVHSATTAIDVTVNDGSLEVRGGVVSSATIDSTGRITVESGTLDSATVNSGGFLMVASGTATNVIENGGAVQAYDISSVTFLSNTFSGLVLDDYSQATVHSATTASNVTINRGWMTIDGGVVNSVTVNAGGDLTISSGTVTDVIENGGAVRTMGEAAVTFVSNTFSDLVLSGYTNATVHSGTTAVNVTVNDANLEVFEGGVVNGLTAADTNTRITFSGGKLTGPVTIAESAYLGVDSGTILDFDISGQTTESAALVNNLALITGTPTYTITVDAAQAAGTYALAAGAAAFTGTFTLGTSDTEYGTITVNGDALVHEDYTYTLTVTEGALNLNVATGPAPISGMVLINSSYTVSSGVTVLDTQVSSGGMLTVSSGGLADITTVNLNGSLTVRPDGTATNIVENGGWVYVEEGGSATFTSNTISGMIFESSIATVHSGTTAADITMNSWGVVNVFDGGLVNGATVNPDGDIELYSGATVTNIIENGGAVQLVRIEPEDSATMTFLSNTFSNAVATNGRFITAHSGTTAVNVTATNHGEIDVYNGGVLRGLTVGSDGIAVIQPGGKLTGAVTLDSNLERLLLAQNSILDFDISAQAPGADALLNDYSLITFWGTGSPTYTITVDAAQAVGTYALAANAAAFEATVTLGTAAAAYGTLTVNGDALKYGDYIYTLTLSSAGALDLTISPAPISGMVLINSTYTVSSGVTVLDTQVSSGGMLYVEGGGLADITTVNSNGVLNVSSGGTATNIVENGGYVFSFYGASMTFAPNTFSGLNLAGASATVHSGTTAVKTTIGNGGLMDISNGGLLESTTVNKGGKLRLSSGAVAENIVENGGYVNVYEGASATFVSNTFSGLIEDAIAGVHSGTTAANITVGSYGNLHVFDGGLLSGLTTGSAGSAFISSGGKVTGSMTLGSGAVSLAVSSGGILNFDITSQSQNSTALLNDYSLVTAAEGSVFTITVGAAQAAGTYALAANASAFTGTVSLGTTAAAYGTLTVNGDALEYGDYTYTLTLSSAGALDLTIATEPEPISGLVISGDYNVVSGSILENTQVSSGGVLTIMDGGLADSTTVLANGSMNVSSGGTATNIVENGGYVLIYNGGTGEFASATISGLVLDSNTSASVHSGTTVLSAVLGNSGTVDIYEGGIVNGAAVGAGGSMFVTSGGTATNVVENGGYVAVFEGASVTFQSNTFSGAVIEGVFAATLHSGTTAADITVGDGTLYAYEGGVISGLTTGSKAWIGITSGGKLTGSMTLDSTMTKLAVSSGGILDFDLSGQSTESPALLNNYSLVDAEAGAVFTVTVDAAQAEGSYALAANAASFTGTITVGTADTEYGTITVGGEALEYGDLLYSLTVVDGTLTLTIEPVPISVIRHDLNGDSHADIIMTINGTEHPAFGMTGAWLIQETQTAVWGNLSDLSVGCEIFGTGKTVAGKPSYDVYIRTGDNVIGAWTTNRKGEVTGWETVETFDSETNVLGIGDFNGDGQSDLLLRNNNGAVGCHFTSGEKTGWNYFQSLGDEWKLPTIGDLNGDGRDDVVLKHDAGFSGTWLTQEDGTMVWADLDTLQDGFEIIGSGDFNGDGTDDVLLKKDTYYGAWLTKAGSVAGWMGLGDLGDVSVEQITDYDGDGKDDLRIHTAAGDLGALLVKGEDNLEWKYYGSVGNEWSTSLAALN